MTKIDKHIEELLHEHDCVIVPDFGGFITSKKPAYFNPFTSVFSPASKKILFNKHLVYNDGLLAAKIAEKKSLSMEESQRLLIEFKDDCFLRLNEEGRVEVEKVGVLFFDKEKNIQFQQASTNFLKESYGLSKVSMDKLVVPELKPKTKIVVPAEIKRPVEQKADRKVEKGAVKVKREKDPNRIGRLIPLLIIPLLIGGAFMFSKQTNFDPNEVNIANFNPFQGKYIAPYSPRNGEAFFLEKSDLDLVTTENSEVFLEKNENLPKQESELEIPVKIDSTFNKKASYSQGKNYHVIAGCFSVKENAERFVDKWIDQGNEASIVDKKGRLYRVSIQSFSTRKEAKKFLRKTKKNLGVSLWILKK